VSSTQCNICTGELYRVKSQPGIIGACIVGVALPQHACDYAFFAEKNQVDIDVNLDEVVMCIGIKFCTCTNVTVYKSKKYKYVYVMLTQNGIVETHKEDIWEEAR
jgi:hypothetical protein